MKLILKLTILNIKYIFNMFFHMGQSFLGFDLHSNIKNKKFINRSNTITLVILIYLFWLVIIIMTQVFIHTIHLQQSKINIFILVYVLISISFGIGSYTNKEFNYFFLNGNFTFDRKKKLLFLNNHCFLISTLTLIYLLSTPIYIVQPILNGKDGLYFIINYTAIITTSLMLFVFINTFIDFKFNNYNNLIVYYFKQIMLLIMIFFMKLKLDVIKDSILYLKEWILGDSISNNIASIFENYDFYHIELGTMQYLYLIILISIIYFSTNICIKSFLKDNYDCKIRSFNLINSSNKHILIMKYLLRNNSLINSNLFVLASIILLTLSFFPYLEENIYIITIVTSIGIVNGVFNIKNRSFFNYMFFLKIAVKQTTHFIFLFVFCQFSILSIFIYFSLNVSTFYFMIHFFLLGTFVLYLSSLMGVFIYRKLFNLYSENVPNKIIRYGIVFCGFIILTTTSAFYKMLF
ncbi:hypothetical protein B4W73_05610 [Staphylococcus delphini]|uniref:hypothetical protein n=1 Tax=Staphylococcus delphini TaxID=53344 RepID=UPI000BBC75CF|nr:hypothetical protein [Staphylococcus delphini]PCF75038.1 hypothetical protein B4W73_05610 [Staphylococcus delphini]